MFGLSIGTKIIIILSLVLTLMGSLGAVYYTISSQATHAQMLKDQKDQLDQIVAQQAKVIEQNNALIELGNESGKKFGEVVDTINQNHEVVRDFLSTAEAQKLDRSSSDLLKQVLDQLSKGK